VVPDFVLTSLKVGGVDTTRWHFFWVRLVSEKVRAKKTVACLIWVNTPIHPANFFFLKTPLLRGHFTFPAEDWHQAWVFKNLSCDSLKASSEREAGLEYFYRSSLRDLLLSASTCPKYPPKEAKQCGIGWQLLH